MFMSYSLSWLAVKGKLPQAVRDELCLCTTGKREEIPESDLSAAELQNDWYLIVSNYSEQVVPDNILQRLSCGCEVVTCFVEEHVMLSSSSDWKDGHRCWSVIHNAQKRRDHLETQGQLPIAFSSILKQLQSKQKDADMNGKRVDFIFDIPVELAYTLAGYRHDRDVPGLSDKLFEVLDSSESIKVITGSRFQRIGQRWMTLTGWQRGLVGMLTISIMLVIIYYVVTVFVLK
jgi:hypothetical protein